MKIDNKIVSRYFESRDVSEAQVHIMKWMADQDANEEIKNISCKFWKKLPEYLKDEEYQEQLVLSKIYRIIAEKESKRNEPSAFNRILSIVTKVAAVLLIPLLVYFFAVTSDGKSSDSEITYSEVYSPPGARTAFYLPDGSKGWLNSGSYLRFPQQFYGKNRRVTLKGEAYFDVVTNPDKPFIVTNENLEIVAKGTSFNVCSWEEDQYINIVLEEGMLDIYKQESFKKQSLVASLKPGQLYSCSKESAEGNIRTLDDIEKYISWTKGKLIFNNDSLSEVVERLNRWYNVNIVIKDGILETYKYVAKFQDENLDEILKMLSISAPIEYKNLKRGLLPDGTYCKRTIELYYNANQSN